MAQRITRLSAAQAAELLAELSDSEEELVSSDEDDSDVDDELFVFEEERQDQPPDPEEREESSGVPGVDSGRQSPNQTVRQANRDKTVSQKKLSSATWRRVEQSAETYEVSNRKDGVYAKWQTKPQDSSSQRRRDRANILREREGLGSRASRQVETEKDAFLLFFPEDILDDILKHTNEKLTEEREKAQHAFQKSTWDKKKSTFLPVDKEELLAFFGLAVLRGLHPGIPAKELFGVNAAPIHFRAAMSSGRFQKLLSCLRFDDKETREERRKSDKFCLVRDLFNKFDHQLREHYKPSECITVDETLLKFRGRCGFKMYMPTKPGKYGILFRSVADANNRYILKLWPYSGEPAEPENAPQGVVMGGIPELVKYLVQDYKGSGRNVTMDRYFTSIPLLEELRDNFQLSAVGTMNANKKYVPKEIRNATETKFCYRNGVMLASYCPRPRKVTVLASTQHKEPVVDEVTGKPEVVMYYNSTKGGVDVCDQMVDAYTGQPPVRRWPTAVLFFMISVAVVNSYQIYVMRKPDSPVADVRQGGRRHFVRQIGQQLIRPHVERRAKDHSDKRVTLMSDVVRSIELFLERPIQAAVPGPSSERPATGRCHLCLTSSHGPGQKRAKHDLHHKSPPCSVCRLYVCKKHSVVSRVCTQCSQSEEE